MSDLSISGANPQLDLSNKIQVAVAVKAQDAQKQQGAEMIAMLEDAVATAKRGGVDTYA